MLNSKPAYPSAAAVRRAMSTLEKLGSTVSRVIYRPDGSFELVIGANDDAGSEFDRLEAAGLL
jgi:hypothetical protein